MKYKWTVNGNVVTTNAADVFVRFSSTQATKFGDDAHDGTEAKPVILKVDETEANRTFSANMQVEFLNDAAQATTSATRVIPVALSTRKLKTGADTFAVAAVTTDYLGSVKLEGEKTFAQLVADAIGTTGFQYADPTADAELPTWRATAKLGATATKIEVEAALGFTLAALKEKRLVRAAATSVLNKEKTATTYFNVSFDGTEILIRTFGTVVWEVPASYDLPELKHTLRHELNQVRDLINLAKVDASLVRTYFKTEVAQRKAKGWDDANAAKESFDFTLDLTQMRRVFEDLQDTDVAHAFLVPQSFTLSDGTTVFGVPDPGSKGPIDVPGLVKTNFDYYEGRQFVLSNNADESIKTGGGKLREYLLSVRTQLGQNPRFKYVVSNLRQVR